TRSGFGGSVTDINGMTRELVGRWVSVLNDNGTWSTMTGEIAKAYLGAQEQAQQEADARIAARSENDGLELRASNDRTSEPDSMSSLEDSFNALDQALDTATQATRLDTSTAQQALSVEQQALAQGALEARALQAMNGALQESAASLDAAAQAQADLS